MRKVYQTSKTINNPSRLSKKISKHTLRYRRALARIELLTKKLKKAEIKKFIEDYRHSDEYDHQAISYIRKITGFSRSNSKK